MALRKKTLTTIEDVRAHVIRAATLAANDQQGFEAQATKAAREGDQELAEDYRADMDFQEGVAYAMTSLLKRLPKG